MAKIRRRRFLKALAVGIMLSLQIGRICYADTVVVSDAAQGKAPMVEQAANGIHVVNIKTPNSNGLSHNQYKDLQIGKEGIVFNNSSAHTQTQLAGYIKGNPFIGNVGANTILNEVTGKNITNINGFMEIAGSKANLILANPNGIVGNNFGFINTNKAILTTGVPQIDNNGNLNGYSVTSGTIAIEGAGLDASTTESLDIYATAIKINGQLVAQKLKMIGGSNDIDAKGNVSKVLDDNTGLVIDAGALGSMYANSIFMIGTSKGVGVNLQGDAYALKEDIDITSDGKIVLNNKIGSAGNINLNSKADLELNENSANGNLNIKTTNVTLNGKTTVGGAVDINASGDVATKGEAVTDSISIQSAGNVVNNAQVTVVNAVSINASGNVDNQTGSNISAISMAINIKGNLNNAGTLAVVEEAKLNVDGALLNNGSIVATTLGISAASVTNNKEIGSVGISTIASQGSISNNIGATISGNGLEMQSTSLDNKGAINVEGIGSVNVTGSLYNSGDVKGQIVSLNAVGLNNSSVIAAEKTLGVTADNIDNSGSLYSNEKAELIVKDNLNNTGLINTGDSVIEADKLNNAARIYGDNITIAVNNLDNINNDNAPVIAARNNLEIIAKGVVNNKEHALLMGENQVSIFSAVLNNNSATVESGTGMTLNIGELNNTNEHFSVEKAVEVENSQIFEIQINGGANKFKIGTGEGEYIYKDRSEKLNSSVSPTNGYDIYYTPDSDKAYAIVTPDGKATTWYEYKYNRVIKEDQVKTTDPGKLLAGGDITITGTTITNDKSQIVAGGNVALNADDVNLIDETGARVTTDDGGVTRYYKADHSSRWNHYMATDDSWSAYNKETTNTIVLVDSKTQEKASVSVETAAESKAGEDINSASNDTTRVEAAIKVPNNQLYTVADKDASYIVETDPTFTDKKQWLSSDYFFQQMQYDPELLMKRVGDGYYERKLVRDQVIGLTGKRYINGQENDEEQFKALQDAAVRFSGQSKATIGVKLTEEQKKSLTEPIVWMVESSVVLPDGKVVQALVPEVYLPEGYSSMPGNAIVSGKDVDIRATNDVLNNGTVFASNGVKLAAENINNINGRVQGSEVIATAINDINIEGGNLLAEKLMKLNAGNNVNMKTTVSTGQGASGSTTVVDRVAGTYVTSEEGKLSIVAGNDINMHGAEVVSSGSAEINAGKNVNMAAVQVSDNNNLDFGKTGYRKDSSKSDVGTVVIADKIASVQAGENINMIASAIDGGGHTSVVAENDINVTAGKDEVYIEEYQKTSRKGFLSSTQKEKLDIINQERGIESSIGGDTVLVKSGNDVNVKGSQVVGQNDVNINASNNINIEGFDELYGETHNTTIKKTGFMSNGLGFTYGKSTTKEKLDQENHLKLGSTIGSVDGNVNITAGENTKIAGSEVISGKDINITGKQVEITSEQETQNVDYKFENKTTGFGVSIGGGAVGIALNDVNDALQKGFNAKDDRLNAIRAAKAVKEGKDLIKANKDSQDGKETSVIKINVGYSNSETEYKENSKTTAAHGSTISAGNNLNIKATEGNIDVKGSTLTANDIALVAAKAVNIISAENISVTKGKSSGKSSGVGAVIDFGTKGAKTGAYIEGSVSKGTNESTTTTYTSSDIEAKNKLQIKSGADTNIIGSKVKGDRVEMEVGGNLHVESQQEKHTYDSKNTSAGGSITFSPISGATPSVSANISKLENDYKSVTEQAGIYAGAEGYNIKVNDNTNLKGAVIDSNAEAEKNKLTTGTLTVSDIDNKAEYSSKGAGISYSGEKSKGVSGTEKGEQGLLPTIPMATGEKKSSVTKSAISEGTIEITKSEEQKQDISKINRNTKDDNINALKDEFDPKKIAERQELASLFGELGANAIHKIAESNGWRDGSPEKIAMHAALAAVNAEIVKGNITAAAITGGSTEALSNVILKAVGEAKGSSASAQWAAAVIGAALSSATGGDAQSGASIAVNAIKNNHLDAEIAAQEGQPAKEVVKNDENLISSYYYDEINLTPDQTGRLKVLDEYGGANIALFAVAQICVDNNIISIPTKFDYAVVAFTVPVAYKGFTANGGFVIDKYGSVYSIVGASGLPEKVKEIISIPIDPIDKLSKYGAVSIMYGNIDEKTKNSMANSKNKPEDNYKEILNGLTIGGSLAGLVGKGKNMSVNLAVPFDRNFIDNQIKTDEVGVANGKAAVIQASYVSYIANLHTDVSLSRLEKNSKGAK